MEMPKRLIADVGSLRHNFGRFYAEPLERGYATTLGNALRRVLLSSLSGAAVTGIQLDGVLHEFSTVPGVVEDVVQLVLNLKETRFRATGDRTTFTCRIEREGEGEVTAADIEASTGLEIVNPQQHLAYLDEDGSLSMTLEVAVGHGFQVADPRAAEGRPIGYIPVDAIFSPVSKANFHVEATRVGQQTDFDRLILEVWTDSSVTPKQAITEASTILIEHLNLFRDFDETYVEEVEEETPEERQLRAVFDKPVAELELPVRAANCLEAAGIRTVRDLVTRDEKEMLGMRNFGRKSLNEVKDVLRGLGLEFGMESDVQ
jgi:DNA-directed RNA polymerase subunit alpha